MRRFAIVLAIAVTSTVALAQRTIVRPPGVAGAGGANPTTAVTGTTGTTTQPTQPTQTGTGGQAGGTGTGTKPPVTTGPGGKAQGDTGSLPQFEQGVEYAPRDPNYKVSLSLED